MSDRKKNMRIAGWTALVLMALTGWAAAQTPEDYLPQARVEYPNLSNSGYKNVPDTYTVGFSGTDPDAEDRLPVQWRMLFVSAQYDVNEIGDPVYIRTPFDYERHADKVITWDHPDWSVWMPYSADPADREVTFPGLPDGGYFLFAVQVMDADGAVSNDLRYQIEVMHLRVSAGSFQPHFWITEPFLPTSIATEASYEVAGGQPINFSWTASAATYNGKIDSYRHGWDLVDPNDPNDPGWAVAPGLGPENLVDGERVFQEGFHVFYLRAEDNTGNVRLMRRNIVVIPFVDRAFQLEVLLVDQVVDKGSGRWPDQGGVPRDEDTMRDAYWSFLGDPSGGVANFDPARDWFDDTDDVSFSDLVRYKAVLCYARFNDVGQRMFEQLRPQNDVDRYVWMAPYQERGGNLMLVGSESMMSFLEGKPNYMVPMVFDTHERYWVQDGVTYEVGFGHKELADGTILQRGPRMYPYDTAGIAALDWTSPADKTIYARSVPAKFDRDVDCVGLKALVLDPGFRSNHGVAVGAIADTIQTDGVIDWADGVHAAADTIGLTNGTFAFRSDEFYDMNISTRTTPIIPQDCGGQPCAEPMWRGVARMDWMREFYRDQGDDWPSSRYTSFEIDTACGPMALTSFEGEPRTSARTNDRVYGFFSYKAVADKPGGKADVYWGFDPYRFDHAETKKAVRWVMEYFGLQVTP